jgi:serine phosphatase RsbU (regulator of sigma subunit)
MVVPVRARGGTGAALVLLGKEGRGTYGPADLELAQAFANRAGVALDNASLYRDRSLVAEVLQQSLLPPRLPPVPGLEIGAAYRPLVQTSDIGGDFYDVFPTGADSWAVAVGDIGGKGIAAAAMTGLARHTIRAAAVQAGEPSAVLRALNEVVLDDDSDRLCTVVVARLVPARDGADVVLASGGHPCPLVVRADGSVSEVPVAGTLLGAFADVDLVDVPVHLGPGDALLLYTDGVTEARVGGEQFGDERLRDLLASSVGLHADTTAKRLLQEVVDFVHSGQTDDIAAVVVRVPSPVEP